MTAPPHTRGSTILAVDSYFRTSGSPAHAGIDLLGLLCVVLRPGLPRTRGDRPCLYIAQVGSVEGSPAHAGIDLHGHDPHLCRPRLPRTRGDRPPLWINAAPRPRAPPHTRGSTPHPIRRAAASAGSPAHAGIDLPSADRRDGTQRLPRTRGDRPYIIDNRLCCARAPPHTRGSTRDLRA